MLAWTCVQLGHKRGAELLISRVTPYADRIRCAGLGGFCNRAVALHLAAFDASARTLDAARRPIGRAEALLTEAKRMALAMGLAPVTQLVEHARAMLSNARKKGRGATTRGRGRAS